MKIEPKNQCPLNNFDPCRHLDCAWFIKVAGKNRNTGAEVEEWGCAVAWLPALLIENAGVSRETGAAVESFRNEMVKSNNVGNAVVSQFMNQLMKKTAEARDYYIEQDKP